jgi:ppGpp synthetase/RelA/SpoT-type nucleotidyltranferase
VELIEEFIKRYQKEYDYYEQSCRMVAELLESSLRSEGIRAIVTSRAKSSSRLATKVKQRAQKKPYENVSDIFEDIVDLAGVRVALYFPGDRVKVGNTIKDLFTLTAIPKEFPSDDAPKQQSNAYRKRFDGYWATHYRVFLRENELAEPQKRYAEAKVEIQVASVLMHAWSEVEHDLVYKPLQGSLSDEEFAILDELNGLVLAGEIALERLQTAVQRRVSAPGREFSNHYDLAASLAKLAAEHLDAKVLTESAMGKVDTLFKILKKLNLNKAESLDSYVVRLHNDFERRPLSEQIIDFLLDDNPENYNILEKIKTPYTENPKSTAPSNTETKLTAHEFMQQWIRLEKLIKKSASTISPGRASTAKLLIEINNKTPNQILNKAEHLKTIRNNIVHGPNFPPPSVIKSALADLIELTNYLEPHIKALSTKKE